SLPRSGVVAGPGLDITVHAHAARTRNQERSQGRRAPLLLRLARSAHHLQALQRLHLARPTRFAEIMRQRIGTENFEFIVVIPDRRNSVIQKRFPYFRLPPANGFGVGEIEIGAKIAPKLGEARFAGGARHQDAERAGLLEQRIVPQQAGLDVCAELHALLRESAREGGRIGKLRTVPVEDMALVADRSVTGRQVKTVAENIVLGAVLKKSHEARCGVGSVRIGHGGARIAKAPARCESWAPCQPGEAARDVCDGGTRDEVIVEVAVVCHEIPIGTMVIIELLAEIEGAVGERIVEEAEGYSALR